MTSDLETRIAELRQRRRVGLGDAAGELDRLKAELSEYVDGIRAEFDADGERIRLLMSSVEARTLDATRTIEGVGSDNATLKKCLSANEVLLRRQAKWAWAALGGVCVAAGMILLLAVWGAQEVIGRAEKEADAIRAVNVEELAAAREEGQRAIAALHERLAAQRSEVERGIETVGMELAGMISDRDAVRAELEKFVTLRDRLGIRLVESQTKPVIVVPEGQEIRSWGAPGLSNLARYNGRMYRVVDRR